MHKVEDIERAYDLLARNMLIKNKNLNDHEAIVAVMKSRPDKIWWFSHELMGTHVIDGQTVFIGYEASARMSELVSRGLLVGRQLGKYTVKRLAELEEKTQV